jgi:hypothetical protein
MLEDKEFSCPQVETLVTGTKTFDLKGTEQGASSIEKAQGNFTGAGFLVFSDSDHDHCQYHGSTGF